jgi:hypothetical protein
MNIECIKRTTAYNLHFCAALPLRVLYNAAFMFCEGRVLIQGTDV